MNRILEQGKSYLEVVANKVVSAKNELQFSWNKWRNPNRVAIVLKGKENAD